MGRTKHTRKKAANALKKQTDQPAREQQEIDDVATIISTSKSRPWDIRSEVFKDVEIGSAIVKERIADFDNIDAKTTITSKSFRGLNITKKDKRKIKHELFSQKIEMIKKSKDVAKAKKKRQKTVITGDLLPLMESLPSVERFLSKAPKESSVGTYKNTPRVVGSKSKQKQQLADIELFQKVLKLPEYIKNPGAAIHEHLSNKISLEDQDNSEMQV